MITRIVKMTFRPEVVADFETIFYGSCDKIRNSPGCQHLELLKAGNIYFTYSRWDAAADLENYRKSPLFDSVWTKTKALFAAPAEAWSTSQLF